MNYEIADKLESLAQELRGKSSMQPLTLGELLRKLKVFKTTGKSDEYVSFDWGFASPVKLDSYRGDYSQLCLAYSGEYQDEVKLNVFIARLEESLGQIVHGWKGGEYVIREKQEVYVACKGCLSNTRIVDVKQGNYSGIVLVTAEILD